MTRSAYDTKSCIPSLWTPQELPGSSYFGPIVSNIRVHRYKEAKFMAAKMLIAVSTVAVAACICANRESLFHAYSLLRRNPIGLVFATVGQCVLVTYALAFLWRVLLTSRYHPAPSCTDEQLPSCTVVVPAYNEGRQVLDVLRSVLASDYPTDRLQVIAVDDGSEDDTWSWITKAAQQSDGRIQMVRLPHNRGKRHALAEGFRRSTGSVLVTIDSDSIVQKQALRRLVSPFQYDPLIGAVAGNVRVLNEKEGIIPRMLDVIFLYSFDFIRVSQSMVNTVVCTPGALSAYRREIMMRNMSEWLSQTFLGESANIGEDRTITNLILRDGYHVHFQQDAVVYTKVPVSYKGLCRMLLRWVRGDLREMCVMTGFIFRKFRRASAAGSRINFLLHWMVLTISQALLMCSLACLLWRPYAFAGIILTGTLIKSLAPAALYVFKRRTSDALWAFAYGIFWLLGLTWITPYALFTVRRSNWLTRQPKQRGRA